MDVTRSLRGVAAAACAAALIWPSVGLAQGVDRCHTAGLSLASVGDEDGAAGHIGEHLAFTNTSDTACWMYGYVGAQLLAGDGTPLPTNVIRGSGYLGPDPGPTQVTVPTGGQAVFGLQWEDVPVGDETTCPTAAAIAVIPPDEYEPLTVSEQITACGGGTLRVTAVQPPLSTPSP